MIHTYPISGFWGKLSKTCELCKFFQKLCNIYPVIDLYLSIIKVNSLWKEKKRTQACLNGSNIEIPGQAMFNVRKIIKVRRWRKSFIDFQEWRIRIRKEPLWSEYVMSTGWPRKHVGLQCVNHVTLLCNCVIYILLVGLTFASFLNSKKTAQWKRDSIF